MSTTQDPRPGRPRSERARRAILDAALTLLRDEGIQGLTVDEIARSAGVSKNTIYRWWPDKAAVLMDAFSEAVGPRLTAPADGTATERLRAQVHNVARLMNESETRLPFVALVAASQHDPALAVGLRERFIARQRLAATELLRLIAEENPEREAVAPAIAIDLIYGSLYYRLLISNARFDGTYVNSILDAVLHPDN